MAGSFQGCRNRIKWIGKNKRLVNVWFLNDETKGIADKIHIIGDKTDQVIDKKEATFHT